MLDGYDDDSNAAPSPRARTPDEYYLKILQQSSAPSPRVQSPVLDTALITGNLQAPTASGSGDKIQGPFPRYSVDPDGDEDKDGVSAQLLRSFMRKRKRSGILESLLTCLL